LISKDILGELNIELFEDNVLDTKRLLRLKMPGTDTIVVLQHGLATVSGKTEVGYTQGC
jgi:hypothetical protein